MFNKKLFLVKNLFSSFMNLKLSMKLIIGYVLIILIPTASLEIAFYQQSSKWLEEKYILTQQHSLISAVDNFSTQCQQIEKMYELLQSNSSIQDYMNGMHNSISEELYSYMKDIHPLFAYCKNSNKHIKNITLYKNSPTFLNLTSDIIDSNLFHGDIKTINSLKGDHGYWNLQILPNQSYNLTYYQKIFDKNYSTNIGFLQIEMDTNDLLTCFSSLPETLYLRTDDGHLLRFNNEKWNFVLDKDEYLSASNHFIQSVPTSKLGGTLIYVLNSRKSITQGNEFILFIMLLFLFLLLSIIYYFVVSSISGRIIKLKNHIGHSQAEMLMPYQTIDYRDEIGTLVTTYNEMVGDINHLLHEVYRSELQKKEANFYALQAQINPHFLYNVLENIRMSAESHQDEETAQMVYTLGKYMRYNLGKDNPSIPLIKEISHINDFLDIYKMRLKDHIHVEIFTYTEIDQIYCPKFILQPIVENSLKHGFNGSGYGTLSISIIDAPEEKGVLLQIKDDGVGIEESAFQALIKSLHSTEANISEEGEHVGLKNVYDRLASYFNDPDIMTIESKPNQGTTVTLRLHSSQYGAQLEKPD